MSWPHQLGRCEERDYMSSKKKVTFKTRAGTYVGKVIDKYQTAKGVFAKVDIGNGRVLSVRPSQLQPA